MPRSRSFRRTIHREHAIDAGQIPAAMRSLGTMPDHRWMGRTRREFLRITGALASAIVAACGGGAQPTPTTTAAAPTIPAAAASTSPPPTVAATAAPTAPPRLKGCEQAFPLDGRTFIATHEHLDGQVTSGTNYDGAAETLLQQLNTDLVSLAIVMPMPQPPGFARPFDHEVLTPVAAKCVRVKVMAGGGSLNPMIGDAVKAGSVSADLRRRFEEKAAEIVRVGGVGFGEMATHHLSFNANHPYEDTPADHPLFLFLAELAARHDVPIDLHHDAVARNAPTPPPLRQLSPNNPAQLRENVAALERLLAHERRARVVWAHVGSDQTGHSTAALYRRLLAAHPNLHLQLKIAQPASARMGQSLFPANDVLDEQDRIRAEWLEIIRSFSDRIVVGGDNFFGAPNAQQAFPRPPANLSRIRVFHDQLPAEVKLKLGSQNAMRIYKLRS